MIATTCTRSAAEELHGLSDDLRRVTFHAVFVFPAPSLKASFDEHRKGTLKADRLADLVVLSTDIFASRAKLEAAEVVMTIFDGKIVYRRPS